MDQIEKYIEELMEKSTPDRPIWNIEKIMQGLKSTWNYIDGCMIKAILEMYAITKEDKYLKFADDFIDCKVNADGTIEGYDVDELNIDNVNAGKTLFELFDLTGKEKYRKAIDLVYSQVAQMPRTKEGNFWHKNIYPDQVWLDGLYMGMPFYAACLTENGEDNWDDILDQFTSAHKLLWDEQLGLYRHANDCSRKMEWADPVTGQSPVVWLRAEGWFLMALADTYEIAKDRTPRAGELCPLLKNALDRLLPYQVADTGMFLQVVDRADLTGNYSETSGSAMVAYALMKGARLGMLPPEYGEKGSRVLDGIRDTYLKKGEQGWELHGICASAGLGPGPDNRTDRTGTPEYYLSEKQMVDNQHGAAACMMAVSEQLRRA